MQLIFSAQEDFLILTVNTLPEEVTISRISVIVRRLVLPVLELHINGIIHYVLFGVWWLLCNIMSVLVAHTGSNSSHWFFYVSPCIRICSYENTIFSHYFRINETSLGSYGLKYCLLFKLLQNNFSRNLLISYLVGAKEPLRQVRDLGALPCPSQGAQSQINQMKSIDCVLQPWK